MRIDKQKFGKIKEIIPQELSQEKKKLAGKLLSEVKIQIYERAEDIQCRVLGSHTGNIILLMQYIIDKLKHEYIMDKEMQELATKLKNDPQAKEFIKTMFKTRTSEDDSREIV